MILLSLVLYTIYENDEFACIHQYSKIANAVFYSVMTAIKFKNAKVIYKQANWHELEEDPSEGQDWNREDQYNARTADNTFHTLQRQPSQILQAAPNTNQELPPPD